LGTSAELYGNRAGNLLTNFSGLTRGGVESRRSCTDPGFRQPRAAGLRTNPIPFCGLCAFCGSPGSRAAVSSRYVGGVVPIRAFGNRASCLRTNPSPSAVSALSVVLRARGRAEWVPTCADRVL